MEEEEQGRPVLQAGRMEQGSAAGLYGGGKTTNSGYIGEDD
jgi:hypothetical protein